MEKILTLLPKDVKKRDFPVLVYRACEKGDYSNGVFKVIETAKSKFGSLMLVEDEGGNQFICPQEWIYLAKN